MVTLFAFHAQRRRVEPRHQRLARRGHLAQLHVARRHHAAVGRDDRGEAALGGGLPGTGEQCTHTRLRRLVLGLRFVQRGRADELLRRKLLRAFKLRARVGERRLRFAHLRLARGERLARCALVYADDDFALPDVVAHVEAQLHDAAGDLRRHGGLAHRLDHRFG